MSARIERVQGVLREQLAEIDAEVRELRQVMTTLDGRSAAKSSKRSPMRTRRRSPNRAKKGQRLEEVSAILKANSDAGTAEIAKQIGISSNQVSGLRKRLAIEQKAPKRAAPKASKSPTKAVGRKKSAKKGSSAKGKAKASTRRPRKGK